MILKNSENNGTEAIGLVTPTPDQQSSHENQDSWTNIVVRF